MKEGLLRPVQRGQLLLQTTCTLISPGTELKVVLSIQENYETYFYFNQFDEMLYLLLALDLSRVVRIRATYRSYYWYELIICQNRNIFTICQSYGYIDY